MAEWYTQEEVAKLLGVSKATVYHYAKQKKIIKIEDPHRLIREARYNKEEVDLLAEERKRNEPTGLRPSQLAKQLDVPTQRIYSLIRETDLPVDKLPSGDERTIYSIPEETANWIRQQIKVTTPSRGTRAEFYDAKLDIALYQLFKSGNGQEFRVVRNDNNDWGFFLQSGTWIPFTDGKEIFNYEAAYQIHQKNEPVRGYTDFSLRKDDEKALAFLDFVYEVWGIENIRIREQEAYLDLSIKSGERTYELELASELTSETINSFVTGGEAIVEEGKIRLISGYRRTTFDLPTKLLEQLRNQAHEEKLTMSEYVEMALRKML